MSIPKINYSPEKAWKRIDRIIAKRFSGKTSEFAKFIGFSEGRVCNPKYRKTIPNSLLVVIKKRLDISSDFILFGDTNPASVPRELLKD
jgi:hypothetical protein